MFLSAAEVVAARIVRESRDIKVSLMRKEVKKDTRFIENKQVVEAKPKKHNRFISAERVHARETSGREKELLG